MFVSFDSSYSSLWTNTTFLKPSSEQKQDYQWVFSEEQISLLLLPLVSSQPITMTYFASFWKCSLSSVLLTENPYLM